MARKKTKKKLQIRRCTICKKIGHNKSTCPEITKQSAIFKTKKKSNSIVKTNNTPPLRFYVYHVIDEPKKSNNVVDLKKHNIWNEINAYSPPKTDIDIYQNYHNISTEKNHPIATDYKINSSLNQSVINNFLPTQDDNYNSLPSFKPKQEKTKKLLNKIKLSELHVHKVNIKLKQRYNNTSKIKRNTSNVIKKSLYHLSQWQRIYFPLKRTMISLVIFSLIIFAPTHAKSYYQNLVITNQQIKKDGQKVYADLESSTNQFLNGNIVEAQNNIETTLNELNSLSQNLETHYPYLKTITSHLPIFGKKIKSQESLLEASKNIAEGNKIMFRAIHKIQNSSSTISENINLAKIELTKCLPLYNQGLKQLNTIRADYLPSEYQDKFTKFQTLYSAFVNDLNNLYKSAEAIETIIGIQGSRRYLLVFQNENELRPTGGFIGSYALLEIKNGKINTLNIPAGGSYDTQGLLDENVEPPSPLLMATNRWHFRDANWFADFPTSAKKLMWFYRHSKHITTDGVIAINSSVLERLLKITGPKIDNKRGVSLNAENAVDTIQKIVEEGPEKIKAQPKKILGELANEFIKDFKKINAQQTISLLDNFQNALVQKEIQMYFVDEKPQLITQQYNWNGQLTDLKDGQDYLAVINTNINGHKSDAKIKQKISHQAVIQMDGSIIDTVTIQRTHTGHNGEKFYGYPNTDYLRLYVPQGSQLLQSGGFTLLDENFFRAPDKYATSDNFLTQQIKEIGFDPITGTRITKENNKTAFGNWVVTEPGKTTIVYFTYKLPFKISQQTNTKKKWLNLLSNKVTNDNYQLIVQKQSGTNSDFASNIIFPHNWSPLWANGTQMKLASNGATIKNVKLKSDMVWSLIMKK